MSGQIFISYRREESRWSAGRLYDRLCARFDRKQVFMDIDAIALGDDFVKAIEKTVGECDVLIAVIGAHWLTSKDEQSRRLDNPEDFVRMEIGTALRRDIRVIPVLVDGALMPRLTDLPDDLKALVRRNALRISDTGFEDDCRRLVGAIEQVLEKNAAERREREEKERLGHEPQAQPPSPVAPPAKSEAANPSAETPNVVYPLPPKPAEPEREKPRPPSAGGTGGKSPSKPIIVSLTIAAVLVVGGLIYLAFKPSQSPPPQPAPIATVTPSPPATAAPTVEEKALPTPGMAVQPSPQPSAPGAVVMPSASISATPTKEELARRALDNATKDHPWVNSLRMKFVPVADTQVLFSVWDTRVQDFETFVKNTDYDATRGMYSLDKDQWKQRGATWKKPGFSQGRNHPVVGVSWDDAKAFCEWLTKRERGSGSLPEGMHYRLPTDEEWSIAVGLDSEAGNTPQEKDSMIKLYPWGTKWPPPPGAGNYAGEEEKIRKEPEDWGVIEGYNDGYPRTSPVGSFAANKNGLYDMGGNVWQWCEDWYNSLNQYRVVRGGSWVDNLDFNVLSSSRTYHREPYLRYDMVGFRCVVARESSQ
jgi:formylglycine-generating enzyme required for sulfatase activity